ncbi:hypothetical protein H5410_053480 [Solanum commersonii]|uniref:Uncharacterized protein n=1 Tax=Solanum commersonii TaxID=4109 RepID=A0A9J5X606_SOLCO|nr:hypothetical protein H5410_053480 [Solanum commersonii]
MERIKSLKGKDSIRKINIGSSGSGKDTSNPFIGITLPKVKVKVLHPVASYGSFIGRDNNKEDYAP